VIQGNFHRVVGAEAVGTSGDHSNLVVEALHRTSGNLASGFEPVHQERLMRPQHPRHLLHRLQAAAQGAGRPDVQKGAGPGQRVVAPEVLEGFLEHPGPASSQLALEQAVESAFGLPAHPAAFAQQFPAHLLELLGHRTAPQPPALGATNFVHSLVQVRGDVKTVQHMQGMACLGRDHGQIRPPHVAAHKTQSLHDRLSQSRQAPAQGGFGPALSHPQQTATMAVNLVNDRQEIIGPLALAPMDFIDPDRPDPFQYPVGQAPLHKPLDRAIDAFPTGAKGPRRFAPRQPPRPAGEETHHGDGHRTLALTPRDMLHHHPVFRAADPPGRVEKPRHDAPQRHKEPGTLRQLVIARRWLEAAGAPGGPGLVRLDGDFDATGLAVAIAPKPDVPKNKSGKVLNRVQHGLNLQLNSWSPGRGLALFKQLASYSKCGRPAILFYRLGDPRAVYGRGGERR